MKTDLVNRQRNFGRSRCRTEPIDEVPCRAAPQAKRAEAEALKAAGDDYDGDGRLSLFAEDEAAFAGMDAQQRAEAMEARQKQRMLERVKHAAEVDADGNRHGRLEPAIHYPRRDSSP